jgi:hypothetical protein
MELLLEDELDEELRLVEEEDPLTHRTHLP